MLRRTGIPRVRSSDRAESPEDARCRRFARQSAADALVAHPWLVGTDALAANTRPMGVYASLGLLADAASSLQSFVTVFTSIYILFIFAYVLLIVDPAARIPLWPQLCNDSWTKSAVRTSASFEAGYRRSGHSISRRSWPSSSCSLRLELVNALIGALL